jgi:hypothetical protein
MFGQSTETYVSMTAGLLGLGFAVSLAAGVIELARARRLPYFLLRRQALEHGWRSLILSVFFLIFGLAVLIGGRPLVETVVPATLTPTISPTPSITPSPTASPTITLTPSLTLPPTDTLTPSPTAPPSVTPTPGYPAGLITPIPDATVTPQPDAVIGLITVAVDQTDTGQPVGAASQFDAGQLTKLVALYSYDKMTNGVQTSTVWYRDGAPIFVDTAVWVGGTGGSTVVGDECPLAQCQLLAGNYRVAVFVGSQLKRFADFVITGTPPTPTVTPSVTATASDTPTVTPTPTASSTATLTASPTATATASATFTRTLRPTATASSTRTATLTPSVTFTPSPSSTIRPIWATDYARTATRKARGP